MSVRIIGSMVGLDTEMQVGLSEEPGAGGAAGEQLVVSDSTGRLA